jgi:iron complex transport system substrate-binding protein
VSPTRSSRALAAPALAAPALAALAAGSLLASACGATEPTATGVATTSAAPAADGTASPAPDLRVVDLSDSLFDLAALGVVVEGNVYGPEYVGAALEELDLPADVEAGLAEAPNIAPDFQVNVEAILADRPDLVLVTTGFEQFYGDVPDELRAAGIEVVVVEDGETWQDRTLAVGEAVGRGDEARAYVDEVERDLDDLLADVSDAGLAGTSVSLLRNNALEPGSILAFVPPSTPSTILEQAGLTQPEAQLAAGSAPEFPPYSAQAFLSEENLVDHDADVVLFGEATPGEADVFAEGSVASRLAAVQDGRIHGVPYFLYALNSATGVAEIVEDLREHVLEGRPTGDPS